LKINDKPNKITQIIKNAVLRSPGFCSFLKRRESHLATNPVITAETRTYIIATSCFKAGRQERPRVTGSQSPFALLRRYLLRVPCGRLPSGSACGVGFRSGREFVKSFYLSAAISPLIWQAEIERCDLPCPGSPAWRSAARNDPGRVRSEGAKKANRLYRSELACRRLLQAVTVAGRELWQRFRTTKRFPVYLPW